MTTATNAAGRCRFAGIPAGETYILTVTSKSHRSNQPSTAFTVSGNPASINSVSEGW